MAVISIGVAVAFWLSVAALLQAYLLYPLQLWVLGWLWLRQGGDDAAETLPTVTLAIAAYDEEDVIGDKIRNGLALDYPDERLDIVVASDASTDRTEEIARSFTDEGVECVRIEGRQGKTACQNRVVAAVDTDVVVFSDANSMYDPSALRRLVERFEEGVDCVVGELRYGDGGVAGETVYWRYERLVKRLESRFATLIAANGAIYAVRRERYVPLPRDAISDFAEPLALLREGGRIAYAPDAVAREATEATVSGEAERRRRITTRSWHTLLANRDLLDPMRHPTVAYELLSHKLLRWLGPLLLAVALLSSVALVLLDGDPLYAGVLLAQLLFYGIATAGAVASRTGIDVPSLLHVPYYFVVAQWSMFAGLVDYIRSGTVVTWETSDRSGASLQSGRDG